MNSLLDSLGLPADNGSQDWRVGLDDNACPVCGEDMEWDTHEFIWYCPEDYDHG
jgi:hypothetical protein